MAIPIVAEATRHTFPDGCQTDSWINYSTDRAYHEKLPIWQCNGDAIAVRHKYDPPWSTTDYWTNWVWDWSYAVTPSAAEIYSRQVDYDPA